MPYIRKIASYSMVGSIGAVIMASLQGCGGDQPPPPPEKPKQETISQATSDKEQTFVLLLKQTAANPDTYQLTEKIPSSSGTKAIVTGLDGKERVLTEEELKKIAEEEAKRVENGSSNLTKPVAENQGLSLGETILASAAGALVGGMIANKLMGNSNYQQHQQQQNTRAQSTMSSSRTPGASNTNSATKPSTTQPRSGFFGGGSNSSSSSSGSRSPAGSAGG
ncbi:hypothetical protein [Thiofilum flexile]|uniref:hypothetical protein n=1 Tax=Thiofilum flexile TaxID=125627 RepID=UPI0003825174|nr:hypothetical protein [Thiofilum flexile]